MRGPDFVREFPELRHEWTVFHGERFICYITASLLDVAALDQSIDCEIDSYRRLISLN